MYVHIPYKTNDICILNKKVDISYLVCTTYFWNRYIVYANIFKSNITLKSLSEQENQSDKTTIAKIGYGHLCLREENKVTKPP
jgi:hypothetical protein